MIEIDLEDFLEDVKLQMTEYEILDEVTIKNWEARTRKWIKEHDDKKRKIVKLKGDILVKVDDEDITYDIAQKFYKAVKTDKTEEYWSKFSLL